MANVKIETKSGKDVYVTKNDSSVEELISLYTYAIHSSVLNSTIEIGGVIIPVRNIDLIRVTE